MKKNDRLKVKIIDMGSNGEGIARGNDGSTIFVANALKDEVVDIVIDYVNKNISYGNIVTILEKSEHRIKPICNVHTACGGCAMQHMSIEKELEIKENNLKICLRKYANIKNAKIEKIVSGDKIYGYRNKLQLPIGIIKNKVELGFYRKGTHRIVPINSCALHGIYSEKLIKIIKNYIKMYKLTAYCEKEKKGLLRHLVARYTNSVLSVILVINGDNLPHSKDLINMLKEEFDNFILGYSINKTTNNVILGEKYYPIYGGANIQLDMFSIKIELSPLSFLQINDEIATLLYNAVVENIPENSIVIDAYCGIGIMTALIAKKAKKVYGIEIIKEATDNAKRIMKLNNIENVEIILGDVKDSIQNLLADICYKSYENSNISLLKNSSYSSCENNSFLLYENSNKNLTKFNYSNNNETIIILDPPRKGCDESVIKTILNFKVSKIIYISCNPATLARDLCYFAFGENALYEIISIIPFNMFPRTVHIETLVFLKLK